MSDDHMIDWFLLERYFAGMVTLAERTQIEHWIAASAGREETIQRVQVALQARGRHLRRDWCRQEAIETVLTQVRAGGLVPTCIVLPRQPNPQGRLAGARVVEMLRHWFEGATELAAAMLLDANEQPLSDEETQILRDQINDHQREEHEH